MVITIDGPAGTGKSTAARELAKTMNIAHLDTGATYRAVTLKALREGVNMEDPDALAQVARTADIRLEQPTAEPRIAVRNSLSVFLDGRDVTRDIRLPEVTENAHYVAGAPSVRAVLVELQRKIGKALGSFVTEGRDQGSVVFPDADVKFYVDARPEIRAKRRCEELAAAGARLEYQEVLDAIIQRDRRDRGRAVAPLIKPDDAIEIDTSDKTIEQVTAELLRHVANVKH